jgi:NitT/TauT family transport system ATP-binding protein
VLSARPGRIAQIVPVDVPRPRTFAMEALDEFQAAANRIRHLIFGAQRGGAR